MIVYKVVSHHERMADTQNGRSRCTLPVSELTNYSESRVGVQRRIAKISHLVHRQKGQHGKSNLAQIEHVLHVK
jgi:hypothetical protein